MGEKDFQQLILVKRFIEKNFKSKIVSCKTIRDKNKLALSSRNLLLKKKKELIKKFNLNIEYLEIRNKKNLQPTYKIKNSKIFIAYYLNKIRLIDNF